jgi:hypothetical protein
MRQGDALTKSGKAAALGKFVALFENFMALFEKKAPSF